MNEPPAPCASRRRAVVTLAAVVIMAAMSLPRAAAAQDVVGIPVGETPEPVQIEDLDGNPVDLADYIGSKPVLLEFWATWCPLCEALQPRLDAAHERYGDSVEFLIVGVAVNQTQRSIRRHTERHGMEGRVLWDTDGRATRAFQAPTTSYVVILDADGKVAYTGVGDDQDIESALAGVVRSDL